MQDTTPEQVEKNEAMLAELVRVMQKHHGGAVPGYVFLFEGETREEDGLASNVPLDVILPMLEQMAIRVSREHVNPEFQA